MFFSKGGQATRNDEVFYKNMTPAFQIVLVIFAVSMYLVGFIAWKVQNDALKRGYSSITASFWAVGVFFMAPIMLPLYILLREKSASNKIELDEVEQARRRLFITCPHCGEENPPELMKCQKCERSLVGEGKAIGTRACPYCGEQNNINAVYCANCRQPL